MATNPITINNTEWTRITIKGDSGTCWKKTGGVIFVCQTDQESDYFLPLSNANVSIGKSKRVPIDADSPEVLALPALSDDHVFYATSFYPDQKLVIDSLTKLQLAFYVDFKDDQIPFDIISGDELTTVLSAGRPGYDGIVFGEDEPVIEDGKILTYGQFEHLVPFSEDTSNWTGSGPWTQVINLADTGTYTISTDLNGATVTITAGTATIDAGASATFDNPDQFIVSVIGTVTITTDTENPKALLTATPYKLPYIINSTAGTVVVPQNFSDTDEGTKAEGLAENFPQTLDALDGKADGVELVTSVTAKGGDGTNTITSYPDGFDLNQVNTNAIVQGQINGSFNAGDYLEISGDSFVTLGSFKIGQGTVNNGSTTIVDSLPIRITMTGDDTNIDIYRSIVPSAGSFRNISVKQISPAQAKIVVPWIPRFNAADITGVVNLLTANDETGSFLFYNGATQEIHAHDGTNTAVVACTPVSGTTYQIILDHGDDSGQKMRLTVDSTVGAAVTHAGSFPVTADDLSIGWNAEAPQYLGDIEIYKEPEW